jgi:lipopolysaccharide transport system ATP-binding protein
MTTTPAGTPIAARVRALEKYYRLYGSPRDRMIEWGSLGLSTRHTKKRVLKGLDFEIRKGECIGVVGRNGSGKSTLIRILCGAQRPTAGSVEVFEQPFAMVELTAGFLPDLTGLANMSTVVDLMGIPRSRLEARMDEIERFSDLGDDLHRPVREYSSGMKARLAFSLFAHLDPGVLLIDEALSVGDEFFKRKSTEKLDEMVNSENRTVVLVTHSLGTIRRLSNRVLWLDRGVQRMMGEPEETIRAYTEAYG